MRPGLLDRRIDIQTASVTSGATGQRIETFSNLATAIPANMKELGGGESNVNGEERAVGSTTWTIRHRSDVDTKARIIDASSASYDILSTKEIGRSAYLEMNTRRRTD